MSVPSNESSARNPWIARPVASFLLEHRQVLQKAHAVYFAAGGGKAGSFVARNYLAAQLEQCVPGLGLGHYQDAVADFRRAGRDGDAVLIERVAIVQGTFERAHWAWNRRYDDAPHTGTLAAADAMARAGLLEYLFPLPVLGLGAEGAAYLPAIVKAGGESEPVLLVTARGGGELVRGWASEAQMLEWAEERTAASSGPLAEPPAPVMTHGWREDLVLAGLLHYPSEIDLARQLLPVNTCTTDVRYETYTAMLVLSRKDGLYTPDGIADQVWRQLDLVPKNGLTYYGGEGAPLAGRYLDRLEQTSVPYGQFVEAAKTLHLEDHRVRGSAAPSAPVRGLEPPFTAGPSQTLLEPPPGPEPGGPAGPVQGR